MCTMGPLGTLFLPFSHWVAPGWMGSHHLEHCQLLWQKEMVNFSSTLKLPWNACPFCSHFTDRASHMVTSDLKAHRNVILLEKRIYLMN